MRLRLAAGLFLLGCQTPLGSSVRVTTPQPFTTPQLGTYEVRPDAAQPQASRPFTIAVLPFVDARKINRPGVDRIWSPDAESRQGRIAQPREVRGIIARGLENGLRRWPDARLTAAGEGAEIIVSGTIERCRVLASFMNYRAVCALRVDLRDGAGRALTDKPVSVEGRYAKPIYERPADWRSAEPVEPNPLAPAVERAIENALIALLEDADFRTGIREALR